MEIGCGTGVILQDLRKRVPFTVGLDLDLALLSVGVGDRVAGDANSLPFRPGSFRGVFAHFTLVWVSDLTALVREVRRILAPGGSFLFLEPDYRKAHAVSSAPEGLNERWHETLPTILKNGSFEGTMESHLPRAPLSHPDLLDLEARLKGVDHMAPHPLPLRLGLYRRKER